MRNSNSMLFQKLVTLVSFLAVVEVLVAAPEIVPIQEKAQGQSLVGSNLLNDSLYSNPAGSSFTNAYAVEGTMVMPKSFLASVIDTKSSAIGGGLGYFRNFDNNATDPLQGVKLSVFGKVSEFIGVGVAGKALWGSDSVGKVSHKDADLGLLGQYEFATFGLVVRNVLGGEARLGQEQELGLGARIGYEEILFFSAAVQAKWEGFSPYQYGMGFEFISPYYFGIKGGYRIQPDADLSFWSAGLSLTAPKISVTYAVEFPSSDNLSAEHLLSTTLLF